MGSDTGALKDQLEDLLGRHLLTKDKDGDLVPLADQERVMRHNTTLPTLTAEQEAEVFAPVDAKKKRMAILQPDDTEPPATEVETKSNISKEMAQIKEKSRDSTIDKREPLDMRRGGLVR